MRKYLLIIFLYPALVHSQTDSITVKVPIGDPTGIAPMGTRFMTLSQPSAIRYLKINADNTISLRTAAEILSDINAQVAGTYATGSGTASGTNTGDNATNSQYSGLVSNATHTGDATGATALTVVKINGTLMSGLATGILKNTTGTGVPSIAVAGDFPTLNQTTTGSAASLTNARTINGTSFDGTANITLGNGSVTLAQMANMATASLIYRRTAGTGVPEVNTLAQLKTDLVLVAGDVGLGNVTNESKATMFTSPTFTGTAVLPASTSFTTPVIGVATGTSLAVTGLVTSSGTAGIGYATGAGGTVTQATNKSTGVTLNKVTGEITMNNAALAAATIVSFTMTNSTIAATDVLILNHVTTGTRGAYTLNAQCAAGSAVIYIRNNTAGSLGEAIVIRFALIKGVVN